MNPGDPFLVGVNYWPQRKAMYWWERFDRGEVREEFAMIAALGIAHVRIFLLWESFQPTPDAVDPRALAHLQAVCDAAAEHGLQLTVTFFTGHMSGPNWAPTWLLSRQPRADDERWIVGVNHPKPYPTSLLDVYSDPIALAAEKLQIEAVCAAVGDHPAVWGWDLGNEPDVFLRPSDRGKARRWVRDMTAAVRAVDKRRPVVLGTHTWSLFEKDTFRIDDVAAETTIPIMHGYANASGGMARTPVDPDFVPFTAALAAGLAGRPVLFQEFGTCTWRYPTGPLPVHDHAGPRNHPMIHEEDAARYDEAVLQGLHAQGALGAFAWCFGDYHERLWDRPPCDTFAFERSFGLYRADGSLKPMGETLARFAASKPTTQAWEKPSWLDVTPDEYYADPAGHGRRLYRRFLG